MLGVGIFKFLVLLVNLEKNDSVIISMPNKIYSNDGRQDSKNYSTSANIKTGHTKLIRV